MVSLSNRGIGGRRGPSSTSSSGGSALFSGNRNVKAALLAAITAIVGMLSVRIFVGRRRAAAGFVKSDGSLRVFGPAAATMLADDLFSAAAAAASSTSSNSMTFQFYTAAEQRAYLEDYGYTCQQSFAPPDTSFNLLVQRFDVLPPAYATELWKYCVLYMGTGNVYWDSHNALPLLQLEDIMDDNKKNLAIAMRQQQDSAATTAATDDFLLHQPPLHHSYLQIMEPRSKTALGMMRYLLEAERLDPSNLHETLSLFVENDLHKKRVAWHFLTASCLDTPTQSSKDGSSSSSNNNPSLQVRPKPRSTAEAVDLNHPEPYLPGEACSATHGEPCCQVFRSSTKKSKNADIPILALRHSQRVAQETTASTTEEPRNPLPFALDAGLVSTDNLEDSALGMPVGDLPFVATVREYPTHAPPATVHETPNYFDILLRNNCLPHDKECFKCLKLGYKEGDEGGDCRVCAAACPCYCNALCQVRPPPKRLSAVWEVTPPRFKKDPSRLIPRVIHQTWFEPVTKEKYPNMSRLINSFRQSGWEYEFYDDDQSAQFLSAHFPPQVREAYDALIPGAFKADLFRYCVLLIRGGVYADMDILLESNLDEAIDGSIGFMVPQDSPGETIGHRSCLWNGLMSVSPGHPFLAQTIQNVVNNVRNRFTSVDYDDMLCPNPVLSVSHTVDTLFTCGPCILGASLNDVLQRHRQTGFEFGDIDLFETERKKHKNSSSGKRITVDPDDPRLLIPGRSVILRQNKEDMGSHRFTNAAANHIIATTDMPEYDDRPKSIEHYSKSHVKFGVYGLTKLYNNSHRANEEVVIRINKPSVTGAL